MHARGVSFPIDPRASFLQSKINSVCDIHFQVRVLLRLTIVGSKLRVQGWGQFAKVERSKTTSYIKNTLLTKYDLTKLNLPQILDSCFRSLCALLRIVLGCRTFLDEKCYMWRHDSVLLCVPQLLNLLWMPSCIWPSCIFESINFHK